MALFENYFVVLELKHLPFKEKKRLKLQITDNGGSISYVVNEKCSLIVTASLSSLSSNRLRTAQKYNTPVVGLDYVSHCLDSGMLLPVEEFNLTPSLSPTHSLTTPRPAPSSQQVLKVTEKPLADQSNVQTPQPLNAVNQSEGAGHLKRTGIYQGKFRVYTENDSDLPTYPPNFQVAKYAIFEKTNSSTWSVLELQSYRGEGEQQYRVVRYWTDDSKSAAVRDKLVFCSTSEEAVDVYQSLREELLGRGLRLRTSLPPEALGLGSARLQQLLWEEKLSCGALSQEVGTFVELLWMEALGHLGNILKIPITSLSLNDVSRAEGLLLQVQRRFKEGAEPEAVSLMAEVYTLLPHRGPCPPLNARLISQKLDLCQLMRDVLNVTEVTLRNPAPSCLGKYRALRCSIESVPLDGPEFRCVSDLLQDRKVQILRVLRVTRGAELHTFKEELGNVKPLLHSSSPSSFVGILSRGLLLPRVGVEHHGIERTDIGNLGSGIYFSDAMSTSAKYSKTSVTDGSRLLLVCDVALGRCRDLQKKDVGLSRAPEGYHSVHGVRHSPRTPSQFEDDEYVVYSPEQVRLKYVVQFSLEEDLLTDFHPSVDTTTPELALPCSISDLLSVSEEDGVGICKNPLDDVTAGLLDSSGRALPLEAVHVKCKLMDLLSQVIIFQKYTNQSTVPIEAKYVFPLDDSAAVCGFEAFINGKHVVGQVKEKEQARREYKQAVEKGHGAYLMDQDAPDVFTISVGNLPPGATVLIKVTFVTELVVRAGSVLFSLPGSVAPWQQSAALNQTTQVTVEKVCVTDMETQGEFTLDMSIEMPYEIIDLRCVTHQVKIKRTDCKAVVSTLPGESLGWDGFQLSFGLSQIHSPRMWVEEHPDKDSQACMLVFYPDFDSGPGSGSDEVVLLWDTSESMRGEALQNARRIALQVLKSLERSVKVNVIAFGTEQKEAFLSAQPLEEALRPAKQFLMSSPPVGGSTDLWRPLRSLSLLPPSRGVRNLLLLSDGHVQNPALTLQLLREQGRHSRLFTCGLSSTANRHMLRALAQVGGGAYEYFDTKTKHNWTEKVSAQVKRMASAGCSSVSVKWQQFNPAAPPAVQAPTQLHGLFSDCHTLVYGFVPHCTQATLLGDLNGQEIKTMVSTSELQKTRGTFLHKLTARAVIRDYEDGSLHTNEAEHEGKKAELKSFITELSKEFSILSQFTSFVAIEERDSEQPEDGFTDVPKLIAEEDVDFLPYLSWGEGEEEVEVDQLDSLEGGDFCRLLRPVGCIGVEEDEESYECMAEEVEEEDEESYECMAEEVDGEDEESYECMAEEVEEEEEDEESNKCMAEELEEEEEEDEEIYECMAEELEEEEEEYEECMKWTTVGRIQEEAFLDDVIEYSDQQSPIALIGNSVSVSLERQADLEELPERGYGGSGPETARGSIAPRVRSFTNYYAPPPPPPPASRPPPGLSSLPFLSNSASHDPPFSSFSPASPPPLFIQQETVRLGKMKKCLSPSSDRPRRFPTILQQQQQQQQTVPVGEAGVMREARHRSVSKALKRSTVAMGSCSPLPPTRGRAASGAVLTSHSLSPATVLPLGSVAFPQSVSSASALKTYSASRPLLGVGAVPPPPPPTHHIDYSQPPKRPPIFSWGSPAPPPPLPPASRPPPGLSSLPPPSFDTSPQLYLNSASYCPPFSSFSPAPPPPPPPLFIQPHSLCVSEAASLPPPPSSNPSSRRFASDSCPPLSSFSPAPTIQLGLQPVQGASPLHSVSKVLNRSTVAMAAPSLLSPCSRRIRPICSSVPAADEAPSHFMLGSSSPLTQPGGVSGPKQMGQLSSSTQPGGLFGSDLMGQLPSSTQPGGLFGSGLMGQLPSSTQPGGLFGSGLMGQLPSSTQPGGLFGSGLMGQLPSSTQPGGLFGSGLMGQLPSSTQPGGLFGSGLMGQLPSSTQPGGLFGSGLMGQLPSSTQPGGLFGSGLMGQLPSSTQPGGLFGSGLMGQLPSSTQPGGLFGSGLMGQLPSSTQPGTLFDKGSCSPLPPAWGLTATEAVLTSHSLGPATEWLLRSVALPQRASSASALKKALDQEALDLTQAFQIEKERSAALKQKTASLSVQPRPSLRQMRKGVDSVKWPEIFNIQHSDGYWECSTMLGALLGVDVDFFANVFLKNKGICSLGARAHADILRLLATLLVLQLMRVKRLEEGRLLHSLFRLGDPPLPRSERWEAVRKAVDWVCWADRQYPCVCSRLEFGLDWESSTRRLLGIDSPHPLSPFPSLPLRDPHPFLGGREAVLTQ